MAANSYSYVEIDQVYGYDSYGTFYGVKLLSEVYVASTGEYVYIVQNGYAAPGEDFKAYDGGKDILALSLDNLKGNYSKRFTKGSTFKKGDLLEGTDRSGNKVVLYFESDSNVHRLTGMDDQISSQSNASLEFYKGRLKGVKVMKRTTNNLRFSES